MPRITISFKDKSEEEMRIYNEIIKRACGNNSAYLKGVFRELFGMNEYSYVHTRTKKENHESNDEQGYTYVSDEKQQYASVSSNNNTNITNEESNNINKGGKSAVYTDSTPNTPKADTNASVDDEEDSFKDFIPPANPIMFNTSGGTGAVPQASPIKISPTQSSSTHKDGDNKPKVQKMDKLACLNGGSFGGSL